MVRIDVRLTGRLVSAIDRTLRRLRRPSRAWDAVGRKAVDIVKENFLAGGRPAKWKPLVYRAGPPLILTGRLLRSIRHWTSPRGVKVGTNVGYGAVHQYGGGHVPARPFLVIPRPQQERLDAVFASSLFRSLL